MPAEGIDLEFIWGETINEADITVDLESTCIKEGTTVKIEEDVTYCTYWIEVADGEEVEFTLVSDSEANYNADDSVLDRVAIKYYEKQSKKISTLSSYITSLYPDPGYSIEKIVVPANDWDESKPVTISGTYADETTFTKEVAIDQTGFGSVKIVSPDGKTYFCDIQIVDVPNVSFIIVPCDENGEPPLLDEPETDVSEVETMSLDEEYEADVYLENALESNGGAVIDPYYRGYFYIKTLDCDDDVRIKGWKSNKEEGNIFWKSDVYSVDKEVIKFTVVDNNYSKERRFDCMFKVSGDVVDMGDFVQGSFGTAIYNMDIDSLFNWTDVEYKAAKSEQGLTIRILQSPEEPEEPELTGAEPQNVYFNFTLSDSEKVVKDSEGNIFPAFNYEEEQDIYRSDDNCTIKTTIAEGKGTMKFSIGANNYKINFVSVEELNPKIRQGYIYAPGEEKECIKVNFNENNKASVELPKDYSAKKYDNLTLELFSEPNGQFTIDNDSSWGNNCYIDFCSVLKRKGDANKTKCTLQFQFENENYSVDVYQKAPTNIHVGNLTYNRGVQVPGVAVYDSEGKALVNGVDYTIAPAVQAIGVYTCTINYNGNYMGNATRNFVVKPLGASIKKPSKAKKAFTAKWKAQKTKMPGRISGYNVQYSTDPGFAGAKTVYVKGYKKTSKKIKKLQKKTVYYVRVCTVYNGIQSDWSAAKAVKTR